MRRLKPQSGPNALGDAEPQVRLSAPSAGAGGRRPCPRRHTIRYSTQAELARLALGTPGMVDALAEELLKVQPLLEPPPLRETIERTLREIAEER